MIIPTYGHATTVAMTVESVLSQSCPPSEIIVVNDGSPDATEEVLRPFIMAKRIRYLRQENGGQASARNLGLSVAQGEFVAFLDDDDLWPRDKLRRQLDAIMEDGSLVLVYGAMRRFDGAGAAPDLSEDLIHQRETPEPPTGHVYSAFLRRNYIVSPGQTLIRASALRSIGGLDEKLWGCDDYDLYIRLARVGAFRYLHHVSLYYRYHSGNASGNVERMLRHRLLLHRKHWGAWPRPGNCAEWVASRRDVFEYFFNRRFRDARRALELGDRHGAWRSIGQALKLRWAGIARRSVMAFLWEMVRTSDAARRERQQN